MHRHSATYAITSAEVKEIKERMLNWSKQFGILLFLDSNNYGQLHSSYECLLAVGSAGNWNEDGDTLDQLKLLHETNKDWIFGHLCYDYKNRLEPKLISGHEERIGFSLSHFFIPQTVCHIDASKTVLTIESFDDPAVVYKAINETPPAPEENIPSLRFTSVTGKDRYLDTISQLRSHIAEGDCYEINYCNEGFCRDALVEPLPVFKALNVLSPAPFAAYYRCGDKYMMCASPERYLRKKGNNILSQPIKGTARRDADPAKDTLIKEQLKEDIKERAENVMIVDLVRNDLARCCETGSVTVEELFGIYTFPQVHQMVSTVTGNLRPDIPFTDALRYSFPMGSMTGAPKYKVMQLIDKYEHSRRELYSGTVGYISPDGDFDFNVVIRSLFYNEGAKYLSYQTGGAITYDSDPEKEWDEMRLKAWALERIFG